MNLTKPDTCHKIASLRNLILWDGVIVGLLIVSFLLLYVRSVPAIRYKFDEADYMFAVSKGFVANYLDEPTISIRLYLQQGLASLQGNDSQRDNLSEYIRNSGSIPFYRHYHAPLFFYGVIVFDTLFGGDEWAMRLTSVIFLTLGVVAAYLGCFLVMGGDEARLAASLSASFLVLGPSNYTIVSEVSPHSLYVFTVLICLFLIAKLIQSPSQKLWYWVILALCLAVLSLEYSVLLLLTSVICIITFRHSVFKSWTRRQVVGHLAKMSVLFLACLAFFWPGGIFKLTIVQNYLFFGYLALQRSDFFGAQGVTDLWRQRILDSPVEYIVLILSILLAIAVIIRSKHDRWLLPFIVYPLLFMLTTLRNRSLNPTYVSSFAVALYALSGMVLARPIQLLRKPWQLVALAALVGALLLNNMAYYTKVYRPPNDSLDKIVTFFSKTDLQSNEVMVPHLYVSLMHYYFPDKLTHVYSDVLDTESAARAMTTKLLDEKLDGLLYLRNNPDLMHRVLTADTSVRAEKIAEVGNNTKIVYFELRR